jgi:hypothetical protein
MAARKTSTPTGGSKSPANSSPAVGKRKSRKGVGKANGQLGQGAKLKIFWAVYNASFEPVALYAYCDFAKAQKKAAELTDSSSIPHFVQKIKRLVHE